MGRHDRHGYITYHELCKHRLRLPCRRVARNASHIFFMLRKAQTLAIRREARLRLKKLPNTAITTAQALDEASRHAMVDMDKAIPIFKGIRTSPAYNKQCKQHGFAMIRALGTPTWFFTLSTRGYRQVELRKILVKIARNIELTDEQAKAMTWDEAAELVRGDPTTCAETYHHNLNKII